jgi:hypothetical protein
MDRLLDRLEDLLVRRALEGLDTVETGELESLLSRFPDTDAEAFDRTAAAVSIAHARGAGAMPAALYASIEARGIEMIATRRHAQAASNAGPAPQPSSVKPQLSARARRRDPRAVFPWLLAAACLVAAVIAWWPPSTLTPNAAIAARRAALIDEGAALRPWTATEDPAAASAFGDVVWDPDRQEGYMRISLLTANDPTAFQYQLWIFDAERDERYPVDGGVFDIPAGVAEAIVPIRAAIPVRAAVLFAVTIEAPGGVVVSERERIALLAEFGQA